MGRSSKTKNRKAINPAYSYNYESDSDSTFPEISSKPLREEQKEFSDQTDSNLSKNNKINFNFNFKKIFFALFYILFAVAFIFVISMFSSLYFKPQSEKDFTKSIKKLVNEFKNEMKIERNFLKEQNKNLDQRMKTVLKDFLKPYLNEYAGKKYVIKQFEEMNSSIKDINMKVKDKDVKYEEKLLKNNQITNKKLQQINTDLTLLKTSSKSLEKELKTKFTDLNVINRQKDKNLNKILIDSKKQIKNELKNEIKNQLNKELVVEMKKTILNEVRVQMNRIVKINNKIKNENKIKIENDDELNGNINVIIKNEINDLSNGIYSLIKKNREEGKDFIKKEIENFSQKLLDSKLQEALSRIKFGTQVDWANRYAGGSVITTKNRYWKFLDILFKRSKNSILEPISAPGDCLAFKPKGGSVLIGLRKKINPISFTYETVNKNSSPSKGSSPKRIKVYAQKSNGNEIELSTLGGFNFDDNFTSMNFKFKKNNVKVNRIRFEFVENHGNSDFTCVYRIRVHGKE